MKIFDKRPLSLILCITLGVFLLFSIYEDFYFRISLCFLLLALLLVSFFRRKSKAITRVAILCSLASILFSYIYFDLWFKAYDRYDGEVTLTGTVESFDNSSYNSVVHIKTNNINDSYFSEYNIIVYLDKDTYYGYSIGSEVKIKGEIVSASGTENFDAESYYNAKGISGFINDVTYFEITDIGEYPLSYKIRDFRNTLCRKIIYTSNEDVGGLLCALLLGEKDYLPTGTKLDFSRIGISHILALSGMHLAILTMGLTKLLRFLGLGKKAATVSGIIFTFLYMTLTGFSVSVTRAGLMLIISSLLYLFAKSKDSLTSLFVAVALICIFEPFSIYDTSLWLSAFATLGIVVFSEFLSMKYSKPSFSKWLVTSILSSFFAIGATFAITTLKFDGLSLLAPLTTLLFSLLTEVFIYVGLLLVLLGSFLPIRYLLIPLGDFILYFSNALSEIKQIYVSTNFLLVKLFAVLFAIIFFAFFVFKIKRKRIAIASMVFMLTTIFLSAAIMTYFRENTKQITYFSSSAEQIIVSDNGKTGLIDISTYERGTAYESYDSISRSNLTHIDDYIFTHYTYKVEQAVEVLLETVLIERIHFPTPQNKTEERILFDIAKLAAESGCKVEIYSNEDFIRIGEAAVFPLYNSQLGSAKKNMITIFLDDKFYTYLNLSMFSGDTKNMALEVISGTNTVILGRHENNSYSYNFTHKLENIENIIISSENVVFHEDILNFYQNRLSEVKGDKIDLYVE